MALTAGSGSAPSARSFRSILRLLDSIGQSSRGGSRWARAQRLRHAVAALRGCFYGLTRGERRVIGLRAGLRGRPLSRTDVARRLDTSRGNVRRVEHRAIRKLYGLAQSDGCAAGGPGADAGGLIGPSAIAAAPGLIAFASPAYQAARQVDLGLVDFSRLGRRPEFPSATPTRGFAGESDGDVVWPLQLLAVMLLIAIGGFTKAAALARARLGRRLSGAMHATLAVATRKLAAANGKIAGAHGGNQRPNGRARAANGRVGGANGHVGTNGAAGVNGHAAGTNGARTNGHTRTNGGRVNGREAGPPGRRVSV